MSLLISFSLWKPTILPEKLAICSKFRSRNTFSSIWNKNIYNPRVIWYKSWIICAKTFRIGCKKWQTKTELFSESTIKCRWRTLKQKSDKWNQTDSINMKDYLILTTTYIQRLNFINLKDTQSIFSISSKIIKVFKLSQLGARITQKGFFPQNESHQSKENCKTH